MTIKLKMIIIIIIIFFTSRTKYNKKIIIQYPKFIIDEFKSIFDLLNSGKSLNLFSKKTKIENIFILISIVPFLRQDLIIRERYPIYNLYNQIFSYNNNRIIKINNRTKNYFASKFIHLLYFKWEIIPDKNITNYIRHIIYHYYPNKCSNLFDNILNFNIQNLINKESTNISYELLKDLISKI